MTQRDVLVLAHSHFPWDPRIRKQVEALRDAGIPVDVVCLRAEGEAAREEWRGARVFRLPVRRHRGSGVATYLLEYLTFFLLATLRAAWLGVRHRYHVVQAHNLPDVLIFAAAVPRLLGARLILDIHDFMPELFSTRYRLDTGSAVIRLLARLERWSCRFAHAVVTTHETGRDRLEQAGVAPERITVVMNTAPMDEPGEARGARAERGRTSEPPTLLYHGLLSDIYDLHTAIDAIALLAERGRPWTLWLVGEGPEEQSLRARAARPDVRERVRFEGQVEHGRIPEILARADAGFAVLCDRPHQQVALPTKMFECIAAGLPVITSGTRVMQRHFAASDLSLVPAGDAEALADELDRLADPAYRVRRAELARAAAYPLRWQVMRDRYVGLVQGPAPMNEGRVLLVTNMWPSAEAPLAGMFVQEQVESIRAAAPGIRFDVLVIDGSRDRREYARALFRVRRAVQNGYDLVHAHYGLTAAVAVVQSRVPVVATFHGSDIHLGWQRALSRIGIRRASARIFVSERLRQRAGAPEGDVIPCGVDVSLFRPRAQAEARALLGWEPRRRYVLFPGSPGNRAKQHELFRETLLRLPPELREQTEGIPLVGVPRALVPVWLAAVDAVLVTSRYEGACNVVKEALACARPIVSVPVGDVPEMVEGVRGCAIRGPDPDPLAAALAESLRSGGGEEGPARVRARRVDSASVAERVLGVYERVASGARADGRADVPGAPGRRS